MPGSQQQEESGNDLLRNLAIIGIVGGASLGVLFVI
jgi:hypothetical protein